MWKFRVKGLGPLLVSMDSHGGSLYTEAMRRRAPTALLCSLRSASNPINRQDAEEKRSKSTFEGQAFPRTYGRQHPLLFAL